MLFVVAIPTVLILLLTGATILGARDLLTRGFVWQKLNSYCLAPYYFCILQASAFCGGFLHVRCVIRQQVFSIPSRGNSSSSALESF